MSGSIRKILPSSVRRVRFALANFLHNLLSVTSMVLGNEY